MEGPTPVSALIHAATLVTLGLFLCIRYQFYLLTSLGFTVIQLLTWFTLILLIFIASDLLDMKRVVAYSTLIQMSFTLVFMLYAYSELCYLYLTVHAVYKSSLFMVIGIVIHESNKQDIRSFSLCSRCCILVMLYTVFTSLGSICTLGLLKEFTYDSSYCCIH